ncbi:hypothetical protein CAEBREN_12165 [Caenorhabditis brenneri]|uniref:Uncharacterized protein n=1 Tax=Caenorhabditis brenneri TaxID=135651 RepID=G0MU17_CAEBE|nr:hypothetical protein CAEBREN_12165 [Caenorhabditis brenneri]
MDGFVRLFCGCCGMSGDPEPPYSQLRHDSVTPIRDPPIQQSNRHPPPQATNGSHHHPHGAQHHSSHHSQQHQQLPQLPNEPLQQQGFVNPVHELNLDAADGPHRYGDGYSDSASPPLGDLDDEVVEDEAREKEQLDNIVENTQHSIIAVGQTDIDGVIMADVSNREATYRQKCLKMASAPQAAPMRDFAYEFHFEQTQIPIQVPLRYDEMSATIDPSPIERMPFSCPDFNQLKLARTMGAKNPQFLTEHPDGKVAGRTPSISNAAKQKISEALEKVHQGIAGIEVEPRELIVSMDF